MPPPSTARTRRACHQFTLMAMVAAMALLSARDAARGELRECGGLIVGAMTRAPEGVKAMAAALAAAARELSSNQGGGEWFSPRPPTWSPAAAQAGEPAFLVGSDLAWHAAALLLHAQLDLPPPRR
jgi:hypothetical protein